MTPRQVEELTNAEYAAFWDYADKLSRDQERAAKRSRRRRG